MARRSVTIDLEVRNKQARKALQGVEGGFTRLSQKTQQSTTAMSQGFSRGSQQVEGSTIAVSNLSRIVEDAPFGARGVANNINPFIQSFQNMGDEATTTGQKMKTLLSAAFTGPGALLTISALITSTMTAIQMGLFDWGDEAESTDEQMETLMETMDEFIDEQREMGGENIFDPLGQASTEQRLDQVQALKDELQSLFDLRQQGEGLRQTISTLRQAGAGSDVQGAQDMLAEQTQQLDRVNDQIAKQERLFGELSEAEEESITSKIDDMETTARLNDAFLKLNPAMQQQLNINNALRPVLRDVELGLSGSQEELEKLITSYGQQIEMLRGNIESGELHGEELETNKQLLAAYIEALEKAEKAQEGLTDQEESAAEAARDLSQARRKIANQMGVEDEIMEPADIDTELDAGVSDAPIDSLRDMRNQLEGLKTDYENAFTDEERDRIKSDMEEVQDEIADMEEGLEDVGGSGERSMRALENAAGGVIGMIIRGKEEALSFESVLSSILPAVANVLFPGGGFVPGVARGLFSGFAHGTDMGFPGIARVGERGEEIIAAPPFSSVITNENVERMHQMRQEAKNGATRAGPGVDTDKIAKSVYGAVVEGFSDVEPNWSVAPLDEKLGNLNDLRKRIGHG